MLKHMFSVQYWSFFHFELWDVLSCDFLGDFKCILFERKISENIFKSNF